MSQALHYIMHIPKTAGLSLQGLVRRRYKKPASLELVYTENQVQQGFEDSPELKMVMGHFPFGYHRFSNREAQYHTFLRNPLEQLSSHYHYTFDHPEKFEFLPEKLNNIFDFVRCPYGYNIQTQFISGIKNIKGREQQALELAKKNLQEHFSTVGITEEFDLSLLMLGGNLAWPIMYYVRENRGVARQKTQLSKLEKDKLNEILKYDWELYRFGKALFEAQKKHHPHLLRKLPAFKVKNRLFQSLNPGYIQIKKWLGKV